MRTVQIAEQEFAFISEWEEVDESLLPQLLPYIFAEDRAAARAALVPIISNIPRLILLRLRPWQYAQLAEQCNWLWDTPLTLPIIPQFEHNGKTWKLPKELLYDSPFVEYFHLDSTLFEDFDGDITKVVATIARPVDRWGDRQKFAGMKLEALTKELENLPEWLKAYIFLFATGCATQIREDYTSLWEADKGTPAKDSRYDLSRAADEINFSWVGTAFEIAEEGAFGNYQQAIHTDCHTILYYLTWKKQRAMKAAT